MHIGFGDYNMISEEMTKIIKQRKKFQKRLLKWLKPETLNAEKWRHAEDLLSGAEDLPEDIKWEQIDANGVVSEFVLAPGVAQEKVIFYIHGGSYIAGSVPRSRTGLGRWSRLVNARIFTVEYRLAPEHPYPAALDDCTTAYEWLITYGGIEPKNIVFYGSSAGGGLALASLIKLKDLKTLYHVQRFFNHLGLI